jgi:predicted transglutaminase-like protease
MKNIAKTMKKPMKTDEKYCKNNEKPMKIDEKTLQKQ